MEDNFLEMLIWFFAGALCHKFLSTMLNIVAAYNVFDMTLKSSIRLLVHVSEVYCKIQDMKYEKLREDGMPELELQELRELDEANLELWKMLIINNIISFCPEVFRRSLKFQNWDEAKKLLKGR